MSRTYSSWTSRRQVLALGGAIAVGAFALLQASAVAAPMPVTAPTIPGAPKLFGPVVDAGAPSDTMAVIKTAPDVAPAGSKVTLSGTGLPAAKAVSLVWMTANVRYILDPKPDSVDYLGRKVDRIGVALANATTDASGAFKVTFSTPKDFGGLHDIFAVIDGKQVAKGGFLLERTVRISPAKGPVGTPITVTVVGMGSPTYESVGSVLYDNNYAGAVSANTTRGWTTFKIRASGKVGAHFIEYAGLEPHGAVPQHAAVARAMDGRPPDEVHGDEGRRCPQAEPRVAGRGAADDERADDRPLDRRHGVGDGPARFDDRPDPLQGERDRCGPDSERARRAAMVERRRQPRELHGAVLELRQRATRLGHGRRRRDAEDGDQGPGRSRRLACRADRPERADQGAGPVLRQAELRLDPEDRQGGRALHRRGQGRRLDADRQHRRGDVRQQLHRVRLRLQQQRLRPDPVDWRRARRERT